MCGIVGAVAQRNVTEILMEGLRRLEYRGYDSAGIAVIGPDSKFHVYKSAGKVAVLEAKLVKNDTRGHIGIAHTRWATHGAPDKVNAHPHVSGTIAVVHNGIIENHMELRQELKSEGYVFESQTDTEVIAHLLRRLSGSGGDLVNLVRNTASLLKGAFAIAVVDTREPDLMIGLRHGSPLVLGVGIEEHFLASDQLALRQITDRFLFLEEGDLVEVRQDGYVVHNQDGMIVERAVQELTDSVGPTDKGNYRHYMIKEIYEQPSAMRATLFGRLTDNSVARAALGVEADSLLKRVESIHIVACGTSYHAGLVARHWIESWAGIPCQVEVASEYRYRKVVVLANTLFLSISQSGETADTLAALRSRAGGNYLGSFAVCNVANSSLARESDMTMLTAAGPEIGVASTKAFTTQLVALQMFAIALARDQGLSVERETELVQALHLLPDICQQVLELDHVIEATFDAFVDKQHALFLGRGEQYPIALEGALKLKEVSYIHAEAYPAGELKHGPLALVDGDMPVVAIAPNNGLLEKLKSNLHEVQARGGRLYVFADADAGFTNEEGVTVINVPHMPKSLEPILYTIPLQLLAYHVAVLKGTDVDQPRNLAKSVTVE